MSWARRKPMSMSRLPVLYLYRNDDRKNPGLLLQEPPRSTRRPGLEEFFLADRHRGGLPFALRVSGLRLFLSQEILTLRVICALFSQYVRLLAMNGSSEAGWILPPVSMARAVMV